MSDHVTEWLNAYLDGELHPSRLPWVEAHLVECETCLAELNALERISGLLHEVPLPEFTPAEQFTAQIRQHLPTRRTAPPTKRILEVGWWMIPVGLLVAWIFVGTAFFLEDIVAAANRLGYLTRLSDWMSFGATGAASWSTTLGQLGILSQDSLHVLTSTEIFTRTALPEFVLQASIALLYLSWMTILWARYWQRQHGHLFQS